MRFIIRVNAVLKLPLCRTATVVYCVLCTVYCVLCCCIVVASLMSCSCYPLPTYLPVKPPPPPSDMLAHLVVVRGLPLMLCSEGPRGQPKSFLPTCSFLPHPVGLFLCFIHQFPQLFDITVMQFGLLLQGLCDCGNVIGFDGVH